MKKAAKKIALLGVKHVVIKGGARLASKETLDLHYDGRNFQRYPHAVIDTPFNHGAGCTFAAAITAAIAKTIPLRLPSSKRLILYRPRSQWVNKSIHM